MSEVHRGEASAGQRVPAVVASHWVWVMEVVFGGVIALGFEKLVEAIRSDLNGPAGAVFRHLLVAACFFAFVIYDVAVYQVLIRKYPYAFRPLSAVRYALDLVMAFCLLLILLLGIDAAAAGFVPAIMAGLTFWHLAAAAWHVAASMEAHGRLPAVQVCAPHAAFIVAYWTAFAGWWFAGRWVPSLGPVRSDGFLHVLAVVVLAVSAYRSVQLGSRLAREP